MAAVGASAPIVIGTPLPSSANLTKDCEQPAGAVGRKTPDGRPPGRAFRGAFRQRAIIESADYASLIRPTATALQAVTDRAGISRYS
jgi:hypothetical protein